MKNRITLGILLACIIGIVGGCSSDEQISVDQDSPEIKPATQESSEIKPVTMEGSEIDGEWVGVLDGIDGNKLELTYRFFAEGTRLGGQSNRGVGTISEGKFDGKNIEFKLNDGEGVVILNNGTLSGDEIQLTETIGEEKVEVILKRTKRFKLVKHYQ